VLGHSAHVAERVPLMTLLSWAWMAFTIEADNASEAAGSDRVGRLFRISLPMWANGLRLIDEEGISVDELSSQAGARCNVGGLERWGWISVGSTRRARRAGYGTQRGVRGDTVLRPTRAGSFARRLWPRMIASVEQRWRTSFGNAAIDSLRQALLPFTGSMPWSPPEIHAGDGFCSRATGGQPIECDGLLVALLGQALVAFTIQHEQGAAVSAPIGANFQRVIEAGATRSRDLPRLSGVSREAAAMATSYLARGGLSESRADRSLVLTRRGLTALDDYRARADSHDDTALRAALDGIVSQRAALAAGFVPPAGCWRGEKPYLKQTQRLLAEPFAALPWHPMVLHRGGWPDGS
jgi:hypothetical protein